MRGVPVKDDKGKVTGWFGSTTDIHDQKCAEEALNKAHIELEQRVKERTAELAKINEELTLFRRFAEASGDGFGMSDLKQSGLRKPDIVSAPWRDEAGRCHWQEYR